MPPLHVNSSVECIKPIYKSTNPNKPPKITNITCTDASIGYAYCNKIIANK